MLGGSTLGVIFYGIKEIRDDAKYRALNKLDDLQDEEQSVTNRADGWGDFLGPWALWRMALIAWLLAG